MSELRRALGAFELHDPPGTLVSRGEAEARIDDATLTVGEVSLAWLDADRVLSAAYRVTIDVWPSGRLTLSQLGRRFDAFARELGRARDSARVAGLLAHGTSMPLVFPGAVLDNGTTAADFQVYDTHVTVVPDGADPFQVPLGAIQKLQLRDDPPSVALLGAGGGVIAGQLARQRDAFHEAVQRAREAQRRLLSETTGLEVFADGQGVEVSPFAELLERFSSPERLAGARQLAGLARGASPRLGFVKLLDPDGEASIAAQPLPEHWASFLLVPVGPLVAMEILAGPSAATYVFEGSMDAVNRDLQLLHFRRGPLALTEAQAAITPDNPHRLALRRLEPLKRLRAATRARVIHNDGWPAAVKQALG